MSGRLCKTGHLCKLSLSWWDSCKNTAARETEGSLQRTRAPLQGQKTLEMGGLDRLLSSSHFPEEMIQEQHIYIYSSGVSFMKSSMETEEGSDQPFQSWKCVILKA